jgi:plastocyanin
MNGRRLGWLGTALVVAGIAVLGAGMALGPATAAWAPNGWGGSGMMGGADRVGRPGMMGGAGGVGRPGMMGGAWSDRASEPGPGEPGFVAGTSAAPRVVRIIANPQLRFLPDVVTIQAGETITFEVTTMGPTVHEFMVGPAADVAADTAGTPEIADIGMMQTGSLTYTFTGPGPFAFACHATGHYEAGMTGTITVQ